jgi:hypothetical protein
MIEKADFTPDLGNPESPRFLRDYAEIAFRYSCDALDGGRAIASRSCPGNCVASPYSHIHIFTYSHLHISISPYFHISISLYFYIAISLYLHIPARPYLHISSEAAQRQLFANVRRFRTNILALKAWTHLDSLVVSAFPPFFDKFCGKRFVFLWRGNRDGFGAKGFQDRCDSHANTSMLILKTNGMSLTDSCRCFWSRVSIIRKARIRIGTTAPNTMQV